MPNFTWEWFCLFSIDNTYDVIFNGELYSNQLFYDSNDTWCLSFETINTDAYFIAITILQIHFCLFWQNKPPFQMKKKHILLPLEKYIDKITCFCDVSIGTSEPMTIGRDSLLMSITGLNDDDCSTIWIHATHSLLGTCRQSFTTGPITLN